ncbi:MAG: hypothetical protein HOW97_26510 [Catenulispora sp.]|nr:hypothetical protein [Catenulispora sp.]
MTTTGEERPTLMTRLAAMLRGEVAATTIEAYRRAGAWAYGEMAAADAARAETAASGADLWSIPVGRSSQLLCTWNAFALQTLGDALVEADYRADPRTVGYLPEVTAEQTAAFLGQVESWLAAARRGAADPGFDISTQVALPAPLPEWVEAEPCPRAHLDAMLAAARAMRARAEAAIADFQRGGTPAEREKTAGKLAGLAADAGAVLSYAESLWSPTADQQIHERVENSLRRAIDGYYTLGQLLAMPALAERPTPDGLHPTGVNLPLPRQAGFDPWCLTDQATRAKWQQDPAARRAIDSLWRYDPDPATTLAIQSQIDGAVAAGAIVPGRMPDGSKIGHYFCCPWSSVYLVRGPVVIDGVMLRPMQQFTFDVSAEEVLEGGEFERRLLIGPFHKTSKVDYCDPAGGGHDDD